VPPCVTCGQRGTRASCSRASARPSHSGCGTPSLAVFSWHRAHSCRRGRLRAYPGAASCPRPGEPSVDLVEILNRIREVDGRDPFDPQGAFTIAGLSGAARMPPKRPGRPGPPLYFYAECASRYADLCALGDRDVVKRLGEEPGYSTEGVKSIISRARTLNLLTPAVRGRASGALTEEGRQSACGWPAPGRPVVLPLSSCLLEIT
jgi:hypothetical protein